VTQSQKTELVIAAAASGVGCFQRVPAPRCSRRADIISRETTLQYAVTARTVRAAWSRDQCVTTRLSLVSRMRHLAPCCHTMIIHMCRLRSPMQTVLHPKICMQSEPAASSRRRRFFFASSVNVRSKVHFEIMEHVTFFSQSDIAPEELENFWMRVCAEDCMWGAGGGGEWLAAVPWGEEEKCHNHSRSKAWRGHQPFLVWAFCKERYINQ